VIPAANPAVPLRGVNLGGWLVLEKWMTPSLFAGLAATDETTWSVERGQDAAPRLRAHWQGFITREDFFWLAEVGINAVRIPLGHWIFGPPYPWHPVYGSNPQPFVTGGIEVLDRAMEWAAETGLRVVLDLHAAPGCQNGFDNGGMLGVCDWHTRDEYQAHSVDVLERLAARYCSSPALYGIQMLNEPRWDVPTALLKSWYLKAYHAIRKYCDPAQVAVIFHDGFRSHREYLGFLQPPEFRNVLFDVHRYQCFERADLDLDMPGHLHKAGVLWRNEADEIQRELGLPAIAGEWSLGLDLRTVSLWAEGPFNHALEHMDPAAMHAAYQAYGTAQLQAFERYRGWFFWSYRTETTPAWCFRDCVEAGWLPRFQ
jgi:glucan 1,3-beta-glucosidase